MTAHIRKIEKATEADRLLHKITIPGTLSAGFIEAGEEKFCLTSQYEEYQDRLNKFPVRDDDIFVAAHPKTGTTWVQEMVWLLVNDLDYVRAKEDIRKRFPLLELSALFDKNFVRKYYLGHDPLTIIEKTPSPRFIKTHLPWPLLPEDIRNGTKQPKIIHMLRNPEDTCISLYHYSRLIQSNAGTLVEFCKLFLSGRVMCGPFWKVVLSYWQQRYRPNILFVKYKDMKDDLQVVIRRVAKFLDKTLSEEQIAELASHLSFEAMKNNDAVNHDDLMKSAACSDCKISEADRFIRRGEVGNFKSEMSPAVIKKFDEWKKKNLEETGLDLE